MFSKTAKLNPEEWELLATFGLKKDQNNEPLAIDSNKLLEAVHCLETLQKIRPALGSPNMRVTASLVIKRVAFLTLAPALYALSCFDKGLDMSLGNSVFEYSLENKLWLSKMPLKNTDTLIWREDRHHWRETVLTQVFAGHLTLLVERFHTLTKVPKRILWENIAVRVFSIYERRILPGIPEEIRAQVNEDYAFIVDRKNRAIFGLSENPLAAFHTEQRNTRLSNDPVRIRRTCCYYYKATEPSQYCSTCPLLLQKMKKDKSS